MPIGLGRAEQLIVKIIGKDKFSKTFDKAGKKMDGLKAKMKGMAIGAAAAGAGIAIGIGVKAVSAAAKFEKGMTNVATIVDTSTESMEKMGEQVKEIAKRIPVDMESLTTGLYNVRSAGIDASEAMGVLETSGRLAVAGLATTEEAVDLLTSAINVYGDESHDAKRLADILFTTVKAGKTTVAELAQGFGKVASIAKETGVSIEDLTGATAILTTGGITASEAMVALKAMISNILDPSKKAREAAEDLGIEFNLGALEADGLSGMLVKIAEAAGDDKQALSDLFGSVEATNAIFALTSEEGGKKLDKVLEDLEGSSGSLTVAFDKQTEAADKQFQKLKNELNVVLIDLGDSILPIVLEVVKLIPPAVDKMTKAFKWLVDKLADVFMWGNKVISVLNRIPGVNIGMIGGVAPSANLLTPKTLEMLRAKYPGQYQKGGVVPGLIGEPQLAVVHGGETIIPAGKGAGINIIVTNNIFYGEEDFAERIEDILFKKVKLNALISS